MRITILGLGRMGTPMARVLLEQGHEVTLFDRTPGRAEALGLEGARVGATVAEAVKTAQVALTMVTDDAAEEALALDPGGLVASLTAGAIHLCMSSIGPAASRRLAAAHAKAGQGYVAAPVLGRPGGVPTRQLWILAAGPENQVNRCLPILEGLGRGLTRVGTEPSQAHAMKLGANALTVAMVETLAEVLAFGEKAGIAQADYLRVLNLGLFKSPLLDSFGGLIARSDFEPSDQTLDLAHKDMTLILRAGEDLKVGLPMAAALEAQLVAARSRGLGGMDLTALALARRMEAGAVASPPPKPGPRPERRKPAASGKKRDPERRRPAPAEPELKVQWQDPEKPEEPKVVWLPEAAGARQPPPLERTSHFEEGEGAVWAWVEGKRQATPWRTLGEVEAAHEHVLFVRIQKTVLLNPQAVLELKPLFGGRARVEALGGATFNIGREDARRLTLLLGH